jgi:formylglycine-generating enzyme required for sulfatase activity
MYREHRDPGLHGVINWLLRQKWGMAKELAAIDAELTKEARAKVAVKALPGAVPVSSIPLPVGPLLPAPRVAAEKDWYVNGEGQTFAVVRGPVEFTIGSPASEPDRNDNDPPAHRKRIGRSFAISTKEVTVAEFRRFLPNHSWPKRYSPGEDTPAVSMTWYEAAEYCNWLSAREGIPEDQWCYESNKEGKFDEGMRMKVGHLKLTGYRLPTDVEWEYACRSGTGTSRYHGRGEELLPRYGWFQKNADERTWPVGTLRPNELGLFDMLGNVAECVEDPTFPYVVTQKEDIENVNSAIIDERTSRFLRGYSFNFHPVFLRSASRGPNRPGNRNSTYGFRPARTLP